MQNGLKTQLLLLPLKIRHRMQTPWWWWRVHSKTSSIAGAKIDSFARRDTKAMPDRFYPLQSARASWLGQAALVRYESDMNEYDEATSTL